MCNTTILDCILKNDVDVKTDDVDVDDVDDDDDDDIDVIERHFKLISHVFSLQYSNWTKQKSAVKTPQE